MLLKIVTSDPPKADIGDPSVFTDPFWFLSWLRTIVLLTIVISAPAAWGPLRITKPEIPSLL